MNDEWVRASGLVGYVHIKSALALEEVARELGVAFALSFLEDECAGFVAVSAGLLFELIDTRDEMHTDLQLTISSEHNVGGSSAHSIESSALYSELVHIRTGYECISGEVPNTA